MQIFRKFHSFFGFDFLISEQYMEIHNMEIHKKM